MDNGTIRVKWYSGNGAFIELRRNDVRLYCTKRELVDIVKGVDAFIKQYPGYFTKDILDYTDDDYNEDDFNGGS